MAARSAAAGSPKGLEEIAGGDAAPVTIFALVDIECPACLGFHQTVVKLEFERPNEVRVLDVHAPLGYHPDALPAARAAECALEQGADAFARWFDLLPLPARLESQPIGDRLFKTHEVQEG